MSGDDEALDRRAAKLSALLRSTDAPVPPMGFPAGRIAARQRQRARQRLAMVAGLVLVLAGATLVSPVRAWIVETARSLFGAPATAPAVTAAAPDAAGAPAPANTVAFETAGGTFLVELTDRQAAGSLRLARADGGAASAALVGDPADAALLVMPGGLRVDNRRRARSDYVVRVPAGVTAVMVRIGREPPQRHVPRTDGEIVVPLATRGEPLE